MRGRRKEEGPFGDEYGPENTIDVLIKPFAEVGRLISNKSGMWELVPLKLKQDGCMHRGDVSMHNLKLPESRK